MGDRFTVTELRGFPIGGNSAGGEGLSVQVLDNAYRRVLTTFRSEYYGGTRAHRQVIARWKADCFVARLTGCERPPMPRRALPGGFTEETCSNGHARTAENTYYRKGGTMECRACRRNREAAQRASL